MVQRIAVVAAILALFASRWIHELGAEGPPNAEALQDAVARLEQMPMSLGAWQGETLEALDPAMVTTARLSGYVWRRYRHAVTGDCVSTLLVCGQAEPIATQTPDVCYRGKGYELMGQPLRCPMGPVTMQPMAEFWTGRFRKSRAAVPEQMRVYWAWNATGKWEAVESPRRAFARLPVLYKLYVISETARLEGEAPPQKDPCREFMHLLLPELQKTLFEVPARDQRPDLETKA